MYKKLTHEKGNRLFHSILKSEKWNDSETFTLYPKHKVAFYFPDGKIWIAVDNRTSECWQEEFDTEDECIGWIKEGD